MMCRPRRRAGSVVCAAISGRLGRRPSDGCSEAGSATAPAPRTPPLRHSRRPCATVVGDPWPRSMGKLPSQKGLSSRLRQRDLQTRTGATARPDDAQPGHSQVLMEIQTDRSPRPGPNGAPPDQISIQIELRRDVGSVRSSVTENGDWGPVLI